MIRSVLHVPALLGDAFYLLLHDKHTGRGHLAPRITRLAMGAAMLSELYCAGLAGYRPERGREGVVFLPERYPVMPDLVQHLALAEIETESQPPGAWMRLLGPLVIGPIAERLERDGRLEPLHVPRLELPLGFVLTRPRRWRPVTPLVGETPALYLGGQLDNGRALQMEELTLVGLTYACGLHRHVFPFSSKAVAEWVAQEALRLPPPLPELLRGLNQTVNQIVATGRH